ncbi:MAG: glycoside hydrolase family 2 TIM barrel-domain containing protein [Chthoniobacterales bacterium]
MILPRLLFSILTLAVFSANLAAQTPRQQISLAGPGWKFLGGMDADTLPQVGTPEFAQASWIDIEVPHNFQARGAYDILSKGVYRRSISVDPALAGKQLYLVFEGAAAIADVSVNGLHLGQHRGAYTRFVFDATAALHAGADNDLVVYIDDSTANTVDLLPNMSGLYKVWGGLYRKVWLLAVAPVHIDPTDFAAPGVYLTPHDVSADSAGLKIRVLLRNASDRPSRVEVRSKILDPAGHEVKTVTASVELESNGRGAAELSATVTKPQLWELGEGKLYTVETQLFVGGKMVDEVTERTGFRTVEWNWNEKNVKVNGRQVLLAGSNLHQEIERKGSAVTDDDLRQNFDVIRDLGFNFLRLPHYPHARLEYDLCDQNGVLCWAENGNSNGMWVKNGDIASPTAIQITTEMVKQNYNHPSIALWSVGNEAAPEPADQCVPIVRALDPSRPVVVANMKRGIADFKCENIYPGWYGDQMEKYQPQGFISEIGAGGMVTTHCHYAQATWKVNTYEPEEYQQLVAEHHFQQSFHGDNARLGLFLWWCMRDFSDVKYKKPVGINTKGLLTYAGDKKDIYYLYRTFLRPAEPTVHLTSQRYFLRMGAIDNGIKAYSSAKRLTLTLNGQTVSTLENGQYTQARNGQHVDNVFYWPAPLRTGKNIAVVADDSGHSDMAVIYFYGAGGAPEVADDSLPITALQSSNPKNPAYFMDMPVQAQWPIYYDLDSTADNSFDVLPPEVEGTRWIATRRVTKDGQATALSFRLTRPATIYIMATKLPDSPAFVKTGDFQEVNTPQLQWRNNDLLLVPAQLFSRQAGAGEIIQLSEADRDQIVLIK